MNKHIVKQACLPGHIFVVPRFPSKSGLIHKHIVKHIRANISYGVDQCPAALAASPVRSAVKWDRGSLLICAETRMGTNETEAAPLKPSRSLSDHSQPNAGCLENILHLHIIKKWLGKDMSVSSLFTSPEQISEETAWNLRKPTERQYSTALSPPSPPVDTGATMPTA
jgi:hypothetical protein